MDTDIHAVAPHPVPMLRQCFVAHPFLMWIAIVVSVGAVAGAVTGMVLVVKLARGG